MTATRAFGGIGQAFQSRNYRIYWWGHLNLTLGAWVYRIAVAWITWELTKSTAWLGVMAAGTMIPVLLLSPLGGVTADRFGHRAQLMAAILVHAIGGGAIVALMAAGALTIKLLFALTLVQGLARAFSIPSRNALVPLLVPRPILPSAIGVGSATYHGANFTGPALGGALIALLGPGYAIMYYTLGAVVAAVSLLYLTIEPPPLRARRRSSLSNDFMVGFRYTLRHRGIRMTILMVALIALFIQPYLEMLAGVAELVHGMGKDGLALLATASGAGAMSGGLWIAWRGRTQGLVRIQITAIFSALCTMIIFALSDILWLDLIALFFTGGGLVVAGTCASSLIQTAVDPALRGRVMSLDSTVNHGVPAVGALAVGWAGTHFGVQLPLAFAGAAGLVLLALSARRMFACRTELEDGFSGP
jgi:MFS family permease